MATSTIASSGGDYTSLSAWESDKQGVLSAQEIADCESFTDSTNVTISGWTTSSGNEIIIRAKTGHRHNGTSGSCYHLTTSSVGTNTLNIQEDFVRVDGIEISQTAASGAGRPISFSNINASNLLVVKNCIIHDGQNYGINCSDADMIVYIYNNIIYDLTDTDGRGIWAGATDDHTYFNTVVDCGEMGIGAANECYGNLVINCTDDYNSGCAAVPAAGYNIASDGGAPGTTVDTNETTSIFSNYAGNDFSLASGSTDADDFVVGFVTDEDGSNITTDAVGNTRSSTTDAGALVFQDSSSLPVFQAFYRQMEMI